MCEAMRTNGAGEGGRGDRVDGLDVSGEDTFYCKALATTLMWTREGGRYGRVDSLDVLGQVSFM